jgi:NADP-dependent 3-hydroxy acid dehydrogenase YdfG
MDLAAAGAEVIAVGCDITNRSEIDQRIQEVTAHYGRIDILVTNAGQIQVGPIESVVIEDFEDVMNVLFWGTVYPTLALLPVFLQRNRGQIVNITCGDWFFRRAAQRTQSDRRQSDHDRSRPPAHGFL